MRNILVVLFYASSLMGMRKEVPSLQFSAAQVIKKENLDTRLLPTHLKQYVSVLRNNNDTLSALKQGIWLRTEHSKDLIPLVAYDCQAKEESEMVPSMLQDCAVQTIIAGNNTTLEQLCPHLDVNKPIDKQGTTLLMLAAPLAHNEIIETLLRHNADVHIRSEASSKTLLMNAATANNLPFIKYLIKKRVNIDEIPNNHIPPYNHHTALCCAILANAEQSVQYLIKKGADINKKWFSNCSPLYCAVFNKDEKLIEQLTKANVALSTEVLTPIVRCLNVELLKKCIGDRDISSMPNSGHLFYEIDRCQDVAIAQYLYDKKIPINQIKPYYNNKILHLSIVNNNMPLIEFLLSKGADVHEENHNGKTPLTIAIEQKHDGIVDYLLEKFPIESFIADKQEEVLLKDLHANYCQIKKNGIISVLRKLLAPPNLSLYADATDTIPAKIQLLSAIAHDNTSLFNQLCKQESVNINEPLYHHGTTLLDAAIFFDAKKIFDYLLNLGADPQITDYLGQTALGQAATYADGSYIEALLEKGVPVDMRQSSQPERSETPLSLAIQAGNSQAALKLIEKGADVNIKKSSYGSLLGTAVDGRLSEVGEILLKRYMSDKNWYEISFRLKEAARSKDLPLFNRLFTILQDPHCDADVRKKALAIALCDTQSDEIRRRLVTLVDPLDKYGYDSSVFMFAAARCNDALVQLLLNSFPDKKNSILNDKDSNGLTPLMYVVRDYYMLRDQSVKMVQLLLEHGAAMSVKNPQNQNA